MSGLQEAPALSPSQMFVRVASYCRCFSGVALAMVAAAPAPAQSPRPVHEVYQGRAVKNHSMDVNLYLHPAQMAPQAKEFSVTTNPENIVAVGQRHYVSAPVPHSVTPPARRITVMGRLMKYIQVGQSDLDHDPVTGTYLAPFGEAYQAASPLQAR